MPDIFLSYSRDDRVFMHTLCNNLRGLGFNVWIDEDKLTVGTPEWARAIKEAIKQVGAMVVILSPSAEQSAWVNKEILFAQQVRKPIFPVIAGGDDVASIPITLVGVQYADMRGRADYENEFCKLVHELADHFSMVVSEFSMDFSHEPRVQISVYGHHEGNIVAVGGDVNGELNVAGQDDVQHKADVPSRIEVMSEPMSAPPEQSELIELALDASDVLSILPPPFAWCEIPAGQVRPELHASPFKMQLDEHADTYKVQSEWHVSSLNVQPFWMAKYPITYAQFQVFVNAENGFRKLRWWQGLEADAAHRRRPGDQNWKIDTHPRERVSWWDAVAFCQWLNEQLGLQPIPTDSDLTIPRLSEYLGIRLPTEWEWRWASQGSDRRKYPWGNEYIQGYANINEVATNVSGGVFLERTTAVGSYPQGASPYGVLDMSGNVWEWCLNRHDPPHFIDLGGHHNRVLCGGAWDLDQSRASCSNSRWYYPDDRYFNVGFRVCVSQPSSP